MITGRGLFKMIRSDRRMDVACNNEKDRTIREVGLVLSLHRSIKVDIKGLSWRNSRRVVDARRRERQPKGMEGKRTAYNWKSRKVNSFSPRPDSSDVEEVYQPEE